MTLRAIAALYIVALAGQLSAATLAGRVTSVTDGDTITVTAGRETIIESEAV